MLAEHNRRAKVRSIWHTSGYPENIKPRSEDPLITTLGMSTLDSETSSGKVVVDFWAPWCGPCKVLGKEIDRLNEMRPDIKVVKVNVDDRPDLVSKYEIKSVPLMLFFRDGGAPTASAGVLRAEDIIKKLEA